MMAESCHEPLDIDPDRYRLAHWYGHALNGWLYALSTGETDIGEERQQECASILGSETASSIHTRALRDAQELHALGEWGISFA
jgi:hypothetical protein